MDYRDMLSGGGIEARYALDTIAEREEPREQAQQYDYERLMREREAGENCEFRRSFSERWASRGFLRR